MLIQLVFFSGYFIAPLISVYFIDRFGYKKTIMGSMLICALACLALLTAASYFSYSGILAAFYLLGSGIAFLQVAGNAYAVILGKSQTSSSRLTFAHLS